MPSVRERTAWLEALKLLVITRAVYLIGASVAAHFLATEGTAPSFAELWSRWDAFLFFLVAEHGYTDPNTDAHATAFFPLFPLLLSALHGAGLSYPIAGLVISAVASWIAFAYLFRWADEELGNGAGRRAVLYLALFPTGVFLAAAYSEALFLAGAIPAFYYARRGRWHLAALPAAVAMGARFAAVFLLIGMAAEFLRQRDFSPKKIGAAALAGSAGLAPLVAYGLYLASAKGSFFYYFTDQRLGWGREFVGPVRSFLATWNSFEGAGYPANFIFAWRVEIIAAMFGVLFVVWAVRKKEWGYAAYMGTFLTALITSSWYFSIPRMMLSFFPIPLLLAEYTEGRPDRHELMLIGFVPLAAIGTVVYTRQAWFY